MSHPVVSHEEWLVARRELWKREKEYTHLRDEICRQRRALPWRKIEQEYVFEGPEGTVRLADLFDGRSQLFVYHFMLAPESDHICSGCCFVADHVDAARRHFEQADLSFAAVSRAGCERIAEVRQRLGWSFRWVSSGGNSFNFDFAVSFTPEQLEKGQALYNYDRPPSGPGECPGASVFVRQDGHIYHTYSTYARGLEELAGAFMFLDKVPKGRNEGEGTMAWVKLHDEYGEPRSAHCCH